MLPVASRTTPYSAGPAQPPRLPSALIIAMPPAAAVPVSIVPGIDQKHGAKPWLPITAMHSTTISSTG